LTQKLAINQRLGKRIGLLPAAITTCKSAGEEKDPLYNAGGRTVRKRQGQLT